MAGWQAKLGTFSLAELTVSCMYLSITQTHWNFGFNSGHTNAHFLWLDFWEFGSYWQNIWIENREYDNPRVSPFFKKNNPFQMSGYKSGRQIRWMTRRAVKISPRDVDISSSEQHRQQQHEDEDGQRYVPPIQSGACSCLCNWKTTHE